MGRFLAAMIVICAIAAGFGVYYTNVYAFYDRVAANGVDDVVLTPFGGGEPEPVVVTDFQAIDSDSSPIRYRACFVIEQSLAMLTETFMPYDGAEPREAPGWLDCFDADDIGAALEEDKALPFLSIENVQYGIDRVIAVTEDGRGFAWHQINHCGEVVFDGQPAPEGCPTPPANTY